MKKRRFSRADWVALGLSELSAKGPDAVKLESICKSAGLTRGSFYHHFADHETYLTALAQQWFLSQTTQIAETVDAIAPADDQNDALTDAVMSIDFRLELGIRELARRLPAVHAIVIKADQTRLGVVADLYQRRFDLDAKRAKDFAYLEYAVFSGVILLDPDIDEACQRRLASLYDQMITQVLGRDG